MVAEKASELALAHAQSARQIVNVRVVEGAELDQGQCPRDSVRGAAPAPRSGAVQAGSADMAGNPLAAAAVG